MAESEALRAARARIHALEDALATTQASELRLRRLAAVSQEGIGIHRDGLITDCNAFLGTLMGAPPEDLIGQLIWQFLPEETHTRVRTLIEADYEGRYEVDLRTLAGRLFPAEIFAVRLPDGAVVSRAFAIRDLTQHRQIEVELRRSEELYRMLADNASDVIWTLNLDGRFTYVSPSVERLRGYTAEEVIGEPLIDALASSSLEPVQDLIREVIQRLVSGSREPLQMRLELEQLCKNGSTVWTETMASLVFDEEGNFRGILGTTRDISAQREMRETLARERSLLRTLIDNLPDSVYVKDREGRFLLNNAESLRRMGVASQAVTLGKVTADFYPDVAARWDAVEREVMATGQVQIHEDEMAWRSGERRWVRAAYLPLQDPQGEIIGVVGLNQDVTERKEAAKRDLDLAMERERSRLLERFLGDASHDLKTPLTTMRVSLAVLQRNPRAELRAQHLDILSIQLAHLQGLLDDLLNLTRMERHLELNLRRYDLNLLVRDVLAETAPLIEQQGHSLKFESAQGELRFLFDYEQMYRAVSALLVNAANYTHPGGRLTVRIGLDDGQALIVVEDTGIGIALEDQPYIFERFFRADRARNTRSGGMGLGLAIARKIVEAHAGRIGVKSRLDAGSVFTIHLPLEGPVDAADAASKADADAR